MGTPLADARFCCVSGWIRIGTHSGGGKHPYANTSNCDYGVNVDGNGNLSGYVCGTNVGWINFDPTHGGVTIDLASDSLPATHGSILFYY